MYSGDQLEVKEICAAATSCTSRSAAPRPGNRSQTQATSFLARTDPDEQESVVLAPTSTPSSRNRNALWFPRTRCRG